MPFFVPLLKRNDLFLCHFSPLPGVADDPLNRQRFRVASPVRDNDEGEHGMQDGDTIQQLLKEWMAGEQEALDSLIEHPEVVRKLQRIVHYRMSDRRKDQTLEPTRIIGELYLLYLYDQQPGSKSRSHFFGAIAGRLRQLMVASAREQRAQSHCKTLVPLESSQPANNPRVVDLIALDDALEGLAQTHPRRARLAEMKIFSGLSDEVAAETLGTSILATRREWRLIKARLIHQLKAGECYGTLEFATNEQSP